jgi:hypothetical protein
MKTRYIHGPDAAFHSWQCNLMKKVVAGATAWYIPPEPVTALQALQAQWEAAYAVANNLDTRTSIAVGAKQKARKVYEAALRKLVRPYLAYNPLVSDEDRESLDIPVHKTTRTPIPPPTELVQLLVRQLEGNRVEVVFFPVTQDTTAKERHEAKPYGVRGVELRWAILPALPTSHDELVHSAFCSRSPYIFQFDLPEAGKTLYVCARWENTTGQKGPWCKVTSAVIP